jgi:hypothetical protein
MALYDRSCFLTATRYYTSAGTASFLITRGPAILSPNRCRSGLRNSATVKDDRPQREQVADQEQDVPADALAREEAVPEDDVGHRL